MESKIDPNTDLLVKYDDNGRMIGYGNFTRLDILYGPIKENYNENKKMTETLSLCKHHIPVKLGICADCAKEHENNLMNSKLDDLFKRLEKLEQSRDANSRSHKDIFDRIENHESSLKCLTEMYKDLFIKHVKLIDMEMNKKPYSCPVCGGSGAMELESIEECAKYKGKFQTYENGKPFIWCGSCEGKGIVWG